MTVRQQDVAGRRVAKHSGTLSGITGSSSTRSAARRWPLTGMPIDGWIAVQCHSPGRISRIRRIVRQHESGALDPLGETWPLPPSAPPDPRVLLPST